MFVSEKQAGTDPSHRSGFTIFNRTESKSYGSAIAFNHPIEAASERMVYRRDALFRRLPELPGPDHDRYHAGVTRDGNPHDGG